MQTTTDTQISHKVISINCPQCGGVTSARTSSRLFKCRHCSTNLILTGKKFIPQLSIKPTLERQQVINKTFELITHPYVSNRLQHEGQLHDCTLVFIPVLEVRERLIIINKVKEVVRRIDGLCKQISLFSKEEVRDDTTINFLERYLAFSLVMKQDWGLENIFLTWLDWEQMSLLNVSNIEQYDPVKLKRQGIVLEPAACDIDSIEKEYQRVSHSDFSRESKVTPIDCAYRIMYYPIWICRVSSGNAIYTISIDGLKGDVLNALLPQQIKYRPLYAILPTALFGYVLGAIGNYMLTSPGGEIVDDIRHIFMTLIRVRADVLVYVVLFILSLALSILAFYWAQFRYSGLVQFTRDLQPRIIKINKPDKTFLEKVNDNIQKASSDLVRF